MVKIQKKIIVAIVIASGVVPKIESKMIRNNVQKIPDIAIPENNNVV